MRINILILFILFSAFLSVPGQGQVLMSSAPFSAATPYLESDGRKETLALTDNEFVVISKIKGGISGDGEYMLEKYDASLKNIFKTPFSVNSYEDVKELYYNGKDLILFTVVHNEDDNISKLLAYGFNPATGEKTWDKTLMESPVGAYNNMRTKGGVEESFENAISSSSNKNFVVPFQYQYEIHFSPDGSKFIAYSYDYSKASLVASAAVFDKALNKITQGAVPIDNNFINHGIFINNRGDAYILNVNRLGRVVLVQYNLDTHDNKLLDIQYSSAQRECLKLQFVNDDEVYVGSLNVVNGKMQGVMYSKFNFKDNLVEKINFHNLSDGLKQTADAMHSSNKSTMGNEDWQHFEITHFHVNKYEKVVMVVEKREIQSTGYVYQTETMLDPEKWQERIAKVNTEAVVIVSFNANDELMWENYYLKSQTADVSQGLISTSFVMHIDDEYIRMVYAGADNAAGVFNTYNFVEWNALNGTKSKELALQNDEKLALVRNYTVWWDDKVVLVGRKGLLGKKYIMASYRLSSGN